LFYLADELLMAMIFYTLLVISKRVASNVWGMLLFFVLSSFVSIGAFVDVMDLCFEHNINIPASVIIAVPVIIIVILSVLLFIITKKVDISKGGTYYFKSVHIFVIITSGVFSFLLMEEFIKMSFDKVNPILLVTILIVSAAIAFGIWYLTASHYKTRKIK